VFGIVFQYFAIAPTRPRLKDGLIAAAKTNLTSLTGRPAWVFKQCVGLGEIAPVVSEGGN
jgi:hypothetical protein